MGSQETSSSTSLSLSGAHTWTSFQNLSGMARQQLHQQSFVAPFFKGGSPELRDSSEEGENRSSKAIPSFRKLELVVESAHPESPS